MNLGVWRLHKTSDIFSVSDMDSLFLDSAHTVGAGTEVTSIPAHVGDVAVIEDAAFVT